MAFSIEDDVIEELDAEEFSDSLQPAGYVDVFFAGGERAGRMVVGNNDGTGAVGNGIGEYFARVHLRLVGDAD